MEKNLASFFKCSCGSEGFEEIMENVTLASLVDYVDIDGNIDYGGHSQHGGDVTNFQCSECGYPLLHKDGSCITGDELAEFLPTCTQALEKAKAEITKILLNGETNGKA